MQRDLKYEEQVQYSGKQQKEERPGMYRQIQAEKSKMKLLNQQMRLSFFVGRLSRLTNLSLMLSTSSGFKIVSK